MAEQRIRQRGPQIYALLTGVLGFVLLGRAFATQPFTIDLPALLVFTVVALVVSYFGVPTDRADVEIGLDGPVLIGATLIGGLAFGSWIAFITGLVTLRHTTGWVNRSTRSLLSSGRNVVSVTAAWMAYQGLGGTLTPIRIETPQALRLIVLFVMYASVRCLWLWPVRVLQSPPPRQDTTGILDLTTLSVELLPLPISVLVSSTFVYLGWPSFLVLVFVFVGFGSLVERMLRVLRHKEEQLKLLRFTDQVQRAICETSGDVGTLSKLAYTLCADAVPIARFELGIYEWSADQVTHSDIELDHISSPTSVSIEAAIDGTTQLPTMRVPMTQKWKWLSEQVRTVLVKEESDWGRLPFALPPLEQGVLPGSTLFIPLRCAAERPEQQTGPDVDERRQMTASPRPCGGIVLLSPPSRPLRPSHLARIEIVATRIGAAIGKARVCATAGKGTPPSRP